MCLRVLFLPFLHCHQCSTGAHNSSCLVLVTVFWWIGLPPSRSLCKTYRVCFCPTYLCCQWHETQITLPFSRFFVARCVLILHFGFLLLPVNYLLCPVMQIFSYFPSSVLTLILHAPPASNVILPFLHSFFLLILPLSPIAINLPVAFLALGCTSDNKGLTLNLTHLIKT